MRKAMIVVMTGAAAPERPPKREAKCCDGCGTSPGGGGASNSSSLSSSLTGPLPAPAKPAPSLLVRLRRAYASCGLALASAAGHREAELFLGGARRELADDLPLVDDEDAVGEREDLLELERDEEHGLPCVPLLDEPPVDELDRADVEAARRLRRDQHLRVAVDLAREHDLLLVAARERVRRRRRRAAPDVELGQQPLRTLDHRAQVEDAAARVRRLAVAVERQVLSERERQHEPAAVAVLR